MNRRGFLGWLLATPLVGVGVVRAFDVAPTVGPLPIATGGTGATAVVTTDAHADFTELLKAVYEEEVWEIIPNSLRISAGSVE